MNQSWFWSMAGSKKTFWYMVSACLAFSMPTFAEALECLVPEDTSTTFIIPDAPIPKNGHLYLRIPTRRGTSSFAALKSTRFFLVPSEGKTISTSFRKLPGDLIEITPNQSLRPKTEYRLQHQVETDKVFLGKISSADSSDTIAPQGDSVIAGKYLEVSIATDGVKEETLLYARLSLGNISDDLGPMIYYVWVSKPNKKIDTKKRPSVIVTPKHGGIEIGRTGICNENFDLTPFQKKGGTVLFGVKAVDYAGNAGPLSEIIVDLRKKRKLVDKTLSEHFTIGPSNSCSDRKLLMLPSAKKPIPLNAQIRIQNGESPFQLVLDRRVMSIDEKEEGQITTLLPKEPLLPKKRYYVLDAEGKRIASLKTAESKLLTPPVFEIADPSLQVGIKSKETPSGRSVPFLYQFISIPLVMPKMPTDQNDLWFEIWSAPTDELIDLSAAPDIVVAAKEGNIKLGMVEPGCGSNYYLAPELDMLFFAIRAVDIAGNRSAVFRTSVDLSDMKRIPADEDSVEEEEDTDPLQDQN